MAGGKNSASTKKLDHIVAPYPSNVGSRDEELQVSTGRCYDEQMTTRMDAKYYVAAQMGHSNVIRKIKNVPLSNIRTSGGNSVLHVFLKNEFTKNSRFDFIKEVLTYDESLLDARNNDTELPHHMAAKYGHHIALKILLDIGGHKYLDSITKEGDTVLHLAIRKVHVETVRYLVDIVNSDYMKIKNNHGEFPLHMAISTQNYDLVEILVKKDSGLIALQDDMNQTSLHCAAKANNRILKLLLDNASSEALEMQDNFGRTIGHIAAETNDVAALHLLQNKVSEDYFEIRDLKSQNAIHYAAYKGCGEVLEYFFGNEDYNHLLEIKDIDGNTPLHALVLSLTKFSERSTSYIRRYVTPHIRGPLMRERNKDHDMPCDILDRYCTSELPRHQKDLVSELMKLAPHGGQNEVAVARYEKDRTYKYEGYKKESKQAEKFLIKIALAASLFSTYILVQGYIKSNYDPMVLEKPTSQVFLAFFEMMFFSAILALVVHLLIDLNTGSGAE